MPRKHRKPGSLDVRSEPVWRPIGCLNQRDAPDGLVRNPKPLKDPEQKMNDLVSEWVDQPMRTISASEYPLAVRCTLPDAGESVGRPKYWAMGFKRITQSQDNRIIQRCWKDIVDANIIPSCGSSSRSKDDNRSYHAGIWHPPTQSDVPFYSKDALQFPIKAMMSAFAKIAGRGARQALQKYDRDVYVRLTHTHFLSPFLADYSKGDLAMTKAELVDLKLGRVGTMLAIADGQSEGWHFDRGDDDDTYSVVFVFGEGGWDTSEKQGNLVIPQLNLEFELNVGDVLFFQASHLLHYVLPLNPEDTDKRIVLTVFTCKRLSNHFKRYGFPRPSV
ncbi:hypothetical protein TREMEDRAFT_58115 [Tremella mesenterica DSM 1558]|uniref:uncharacterized protein n=1 Tax=Tremella mesenterica (strain ATCC 24925 / CBS 8224 / DSM 1558 / NBRC 9311 / NRRL Y-6157 / RJB 2259-6 / UBC 559-6) TaxID=578456 RepID=UPI0003F49DF6|nr:uncharacterized protein TREMEDRAFT_58115 [Tremella mesenterica DSM 1558]EIW71972.1 hypothetical protein TREMEDRAFT_58115 [Tremella mesenterica DSM 1558]